MKLFREAYDNYEVITEEINGVKKYYLQGVFLQANRKNRNGRIYPLSILEKAVDEYVRDMINENRALGELGHPKGPDIDYERTCIKIESIHREGNDFIGKALVMDTEKGIIVQRHLDAKVKIGVSSRALGTVTKKDGASYVNDDLVIRAIDVVSDPSAPDAFPDGIMESKTWKLENGIYIEAAENKNTINEDTLLEHFEKLFNRYQRKS